MGSFKIKINRKRAMRDYYKRYTFFIPLETQKQINEQTTTKQNKQTTRRTNKQMNKQANKQKMTKTARNTFFSADHFIVGLILQGALIFYPKKCALI